MSQLTIELPEALLRRFRRGATAAHKSLEEFLVERLASAALPLSDDLPPDLQAELAPLERLDDAGLWQVAAEQLSASEQAQYDALLDRNSRGSLSAPEVARLHALGDRARRITLRRSHAYMILNWRGLDLSDEEALRQPS